MEYLINYRYNLLKLYQNNVTVFIMEGLDYNMLIETSLGSKLWVVEDYYHSIFNRLSRLPLDVEPEVIVAGRVCRQRRNVSFFSDVSTGYKYSGKEATSKPLYEHHVLVKLLRRVNRSLGSNFNGILVNEYTDGTKYISSHSDDERYLYKGGSMIPNMVASISFGATRTFRVRDKATRKIVLDYKQQDGTLLMMEGNFQKEFKHEIPQQKLIKESRISVTFRQHIN